MVMDMQKFLFVNKILRYILLFVVVVIIFFVIDTWLYSPLGKTQFNMLFPNYQGSERKIYHCDLIGFSLHGELLELYLYDSVQGNIENTFPKIQYKWENNYLDNAYVSCWQRCPFDSSVINKLDIQLLKNSFKEKCGFSLKNEIENRDNYYSYIYLSQHENYIFLYNPNKKILCYIRRRGF